MNFSFVFLLNFWINISLVQGQENRLLGTWVLDFAMNGNKEIIDVHSPMFSNETIYTISSSKLIVNSMSFKANYDSFNNINLLDRTLYYRFEGDYLVIQERGSPDQVLCFMKDSLFLKTYPEFQPKYEIRNGEKLMLQTPFKKATFTSSLEFTEVLAYYSPELKKKSKGEFYCEIEFVLDTNSKIRDVVFPIALDKKLQEDILKAMPKVNEYYFNYTKENILIKERINYMSMKKTNMSEEMKNFVENYNKGSKFYRSNEPEQAIKCFEEVKDIEVNRNRYGGMYYDDYLKTMGICYLMVGKQDEACKVFNKWGSLSDFKVRNFLRFFCHKEEVGKDNELLK